MDLQISLGPQQRDGTGDGRARWQPTLSSSLSARPLSRICSASPIASIDPLVGRLVRGGASDAVSRRRPCQQQLSLKKRTNVSRRAALLIRMEPGALGEQLWVGSLLLFTQPHPSLHTTMRRYSGQKICVCRGAVLPADGVACLLLAARARADFGANCCRNGRRIYMLFCFLCGSGGPSDRPGGGPLTENSYSAPPYSSDPPIGAPTPLTVK